MEAKLCENLKVLLTNQLTGVDARDDAESMKKYDLVCSFRKFINFGEYKHP